VNIKQKIEAKAREIHAKAEAGKALRDLAEKEDRDLTEDEAKQLETLAGDAKVLQEERATLQKQMEEMDALMLAGRQVTTLPAEPQVPVTATLGSVNAPVVSTIHAQPKEQDFGPFKCFGEQLQAIYRAGLGPGAGEVDPRLFQVPGMQAAASGLHTGLGSTGGFLIQTDFAGALFETAATTGEILPRVDRYTVGPNSDSAEWVDVDETSVATTVFGGVVMYWEAEAESTTASKPKLRKRKLALEKLMGVAYATNELLQDTTFVNSLYTKAFATALARKLEGDIIAGNGNGRPMGILNGLDLIQVSKQAGQAASTFHYKNFTGMWNRAYPNRRSNMIWLIHPDGEEKLYDMTFPVGAGGVPVFLPPGGLTGSPYATLLSRPIVPTDHCSALSSKGDVFLADLNDYILIDKGGVNAEQSMHVRFLNDEQTFRWTFRANGMPKKPSALTIKNSSNTRSSFVTLQAR
jgi:HK97 family phage major capsid protein